MANQPAPQLAPQSTPTVVPLARDHAGVSIPVPEGARAWRVRRHTGGRPRLHLDARKQPMELPLAYTLADLEEILPPGLYRLDLVDAGGSDLDVTVPVNLAAHRSQEPEQADDDSVAISVPAGTSDVRLVLEANVRAMQLQFQHHERTLATSLRMAETLRDGVQTLAESQADCFKSLVSTRGFMRNAGGFGSAAMMQPQLAAPTNENEHASEEDEEENDEPPLPVGDPMWNALAMILTPVVTKIVDNMFVGGAAQSTAIAAKPKQPFTLGALLDWRKAAPKAVEAPKIVEAEPPITAPEVMAMVPPDLMSRLMHVASTLAPDEREKVLPLMQSIPRENFPALITQLQAMSNEELTAQVRVSIGGVS